MMALECLRGFDGWEACNPSQHGRAAAARDRGQAFLGESPVLGREPLGLTPSGQAHTWLSRPTQRTPRPEI
eukprot:1138770-Pelagomonas_calceolata.AAC.9